MEDKSSLVAIILITLISIWTANKTLKLKNPYHNRYGFLSFNI
ncbi:hypothetical protein [Clostridium estertheticum]|nr:hypothetical protein [Clostridium estertheticum]